MIDLNIKVINMQQNKVNRAYFIALVTSILIYILGIGTGLYIQKTNAAKTQQLVESLQRRVESAQLEYVYISTLGDRISCDSLSTLVDETTRDVRNIGSKLAELEKKNETGNSFDTLKRDYTILSSRGWILNTYVQERCQKNTTTILYFYSIPCSDCEKQGYILDDLAEHEFKDKFLVFVLDAQIEEPIVATLKTTFNIHSTPSIVVGNTTYVGLQTKDNLEKIISQELTS